MHSTYATCQASPQRLAIIGWTASLHDILKSQTPKIRGPNWVEERAATSFRPSLEYGTDRSISRKLVERLQEVSRQCFRIEREDTIQHRGKRG